MIDLKDFTFAIPFRYDSEDRINNLRRVIKYFEKYFINYEIIVNESDQEQKATKVGTFENVKFLFNYNNDSMFHKSKVLNDTFRLCNRKYMSCYDLDTMVHPDAFMHVQKYFEQNPQLLFVFPYNGIFLDMAKNYIDIFEKSNFDIKYFPNIQNCGVHSIVSIDDINYQCANNRSPGGIVVLRNCQATWNIGVYNENIKGCGNEDDEIAIRFEKLGYAPIRAPFNLIHMQHHRGPSCYPHIFSSQSLAEQQKIVSMTPQQLKQYIETTFSWRAR